MDKRTCNVPDCEKPPYGNRAHCHMHRARLRKWGTTDLVKTPRKPPTVAPISEKLEAKTRKALEGCWLWTGPLDHYGYGVLNHRGTGLKAHRVAYEQWVGPIPPRMVIDHTCHNPACVRPDHLRPATIKQNTENHSGATRLSKSGIRGVWKNSQTGLWHVQVTHRGRKHWGGSHKTVAEAEAAATALRIKLHTHNDMDRAVA